MLARPYLLVKVYFLLVNLYQNGKGFFVVPLRKCINMWVLIEKQININGVYSLILRKSLLLLGIGSAQIDLILPKNTYKSGECINGYFLIKGGTLAQRIRRIECDLIMDTHSTGMEEILKTSTILSTREINSGESNEIPFNFCLPILKEPYKRGVSYRLKTRLILDKGIIGKDDDWILIDSE
ncbi:sporulation protein [Peribacillus frigoritolerans]|uniref:sporulation protein n=1 Tax=Bacillaceae TaxID=186817 RepID=UPI000B02947C|nr:MULTISPECIES: sporulation protein [Bacillaceae]MDM5306505.1 sporulation protein [Peribacillus frigoritolerans]USK82764.1 sporulation protein [Peribacillus frigoritolerans]WJE50029.1 sporulation protein [Peribacillus frigoritolerans]